MRIPFRERNPVPIGLSAFAVIAVLLALAMNLDKIPLVSGGTSRTAAFKEAAGLKPDEEVRIAGVKVGKVTALDLDGDHVKVTFRVDDGVRLGDRTEAGIKIKTILGAHYLELTPRGKGRLGRSIPIERTHTPFEVVPAISELSQRVGAIDVQQVARNPPAGAGRLERPEGHAGRGPLRRSEPHLPDLGRRQRPHPHVRPLPGPGPVHRPRIRDRRDGPGPHQPDHDHPGHDPAHRRPSQRSPAR